MRIAYYTYPWFLDHSLPLVRAMSHRAEVHLLVEISPEAREAGWFGEQELPEVPGVYSAEPALTRGYLSQAAPFLKGLASFSFVSHTSYRALAAPGAVRTSLEAAWHIRKLRPDVIHFESGRSRTAPLFFLTPGIAKVLAIHDAQIHLGERVHRRYQIRALVVPRSTRLLFYSRYSRDLFAPFARGRPSSVVPLGVKEVFREWPGPTAPERDGTVLMFGRLAQYKGLDVLYRAAPQIARAVPGARIVVAGMLAGGYRPPAPPSLPNGAELVTHFDKVDVPTLRRLFQEASVIVAPYVDASQSGVVQTAYAFRKPVVATSVGGLPEAVHDGATGRLVPPGDADALACAVSGLLRDRDARERMCEGIRQAEASTFGWGSIADELHAVYGKAAAREA